MNLTDSEAKVFEAIRKSKPLPPTIRELCDATGITSTSVLRCYLDKLESKGFIQRLPRKSRGILLKKRVTPT